MSDPIFGTAGDDSLFGTDEGESLSGFDGSDFIFGGGGDDTLNGGLGDDLLFGGAGNDTYVYEAGDGIDSIFEEAGDDTVQFGAGIAPSDVLVTSDPFGNLYLEAGGPQNRLEPRHWFTCAGKGEQVRFADGTVWDAAELQGRMTTAPRTAFGDILNLSPAHDGLAP